MEDLVSFVKRMKEFQQRVNRAAESILENERLTADLDDASAKVLIDWGVACAEKIARSTAGLNEAEAEEAMYPRLRATRRLMRRVNNWVADRRTMDATASATALDEISTLAEIIYGGDYVPPSRARRDAFLRLHFEYADDPQQLITRLRDLFESSSDASSANGGGKDGQENQHSNH
jgi:hypothetical protein